jgi:hypothetical protein
MMQVTVSASARAEKQKSTTGIELGLRAGYAIPLGSVAAGAASASANANLSDLFSGQIPFWFDAGYRIPNLYVGAFFQFGYLILANNLGCGQPVVTCRGGDLVFGANAHYHFRPGGPFDPWIGIGFGFEWANEDESLGNIADRGQLDGWQFVSFQLGADWAGTNYGTGPFVAFSVGQYSSISASEEGPRDPGLVPATSRIRRCTNG